MPHATWKERDLWPICSWGRGYEGAILWQQQQQHGGNTAVTCSWSSSWCGMLHGLYWIDNDRLVRKCAICDWLNCEGTPPLTTGLKCLHSRVDTQISPRFDKINPSRAQWSLYVPHSGHYIYRQFNIQQFYVLPTQCIYVFCVDLRTNSDYFPIQH